MIARSVLRGLLKPALRLALTDTSGRGWCFRVTAQAIRSELLFAVLLKETMVVEKSELPFARVTTGETKLDGLRVACKGKASSTAMASARRP